MGEKTARTAPRAGAKRPYRGSLNPDAVVAYIAENCTDATLEGVGARFGCHPNSVTRLLRQACGGASFQDVLSRARIERARKLLDHGATVEEAAHGSGYGSSSHFYAAFRRCCGCTPGAYRRRAVAGARSGSTVSTPASTMSAHPASSTDPGTSPDASASVPMVTGISR